MSGFYRWLTDMASINWPGLSGERPARTFMHLPLDVFVHICEWLSVRDILALRMANKRMARITDESIIWNSLLRRLMVPLPILPPTSRFRFGQVAPQTYERLLTRALYLEQNWRRLNPVATHSRFEAFDTTVLMKMLPGGKYVVNVMKTSKDGRYSLVVWDLDHGGKKVALTGVTSVAPFLMLEVKYGVANGLTSIVIAYARPPGETETARGALTTIVVFSIPIYILENLASHQPDSESFRSYAASVAFPFILNHKSSTSCDVGQLALAEYEGEMVLAVVHRPRALVFHYLTSRKRGNLLLGPIHPYSELRHSIWAVKLLPSQNSVLVSRVLIEAGIPQSSNLFSLDIFHLPSMGMTRSNPTPVSRQLISGLHIDGFYFSDLETSWFASLKDTAGLLPAPANNEPPPISIFLTTNHPRGFVHCILRPEAVADQYIHLPYNRGFIRRFTYTLPANKVSHHEWTDDYARPVVIPGAYRSIISMRPHVKLGSVEPVKGTEVLRICTYRTRGEEYVFSTPRGTGNLRTTVDHVLEEEDEVRSGVGNRGLLNVPVLPNSIAWDMMYGTTAVAFDESVGRMCVATNQCTEVHVLDFGGGNRVM